MNCRSSSAEISRWTPDFDLRSSASRISSKLGETPASARRALMKVRSSCCLTVNMAPYPIRERMRNVYRTDRRSSRTGGDERRDQRAAMLGGDAFRVELDSVDRGLRVPDA